MVMASSGKLAALAEQRDLFVYVSESGLPSRPCCVLLSPDRVILLLIPVSVTVACDPSRGRDIVAVCRESFVSASFTLVARGGGAMLISSHVQASGSELGFVAVVVRRRR